MALEPLQKPNNCPIKEDLRFQQATWIVERAGWIVMAIIVVAALGGLFGGSSTREDVQDASGRLRVSYQHFQRQFNPTALNLTVDARGRSFFELTVDKELFSTFEIRSVAPEPVETKAHKGGLLMRFAATPERGVSSAITIMGAPNRSGRVRGYIGLVGESDSASLCIFIYP